MSDSPDSLSDRSADAKTGNNDDIASPSEPRASGPGMTVSRVFSTDGVSPYDQLAWSKRSAVIAASDGHEVFRQDDVEFPESWSDDSVRITASKYFWGQQGTDERESSLRQLINRVCLIATWGYIDGYFVSDDDAERFESELKWLCLNQYGSFNSPVWFNLGCNPNNQGYCWDSRNSAVAFCADVPWSTYQISACFIVSVEDNILSISKRAVTEMAIFKDGSGAGSDNSRLRSSRERIRGGGYASGPVSFMSVYDQVAKTTKSGGKTRRAAKMEIIRCDHPDVMEFIKAKEIEEAKAHALIREGYEANFNGVAYGSVLFQNSNFSVRVTDDFMRAVEADAEWQTLSVVTGEPIAADGTRMPVYRAREIIDAVAEGTWRCGDPGLQYDDVIQQWNTCSNTDKIWSTNPCCFVGDTLVRTSEGKLPIRELARMSMIGMKLPMAFSFDFDAGVPVLRQIEHAWKAGETKRLVEVRTDKGMVFRCTPEHRFYLRSGKPIQAIALKPEDRLRKIGRSRIGKDPRSSIETKNGTFYQSRWMWEQANGPIPDGYEVHHKNEDRWDDRLSNLELKAQFDHRSDHQRGQSNSRYIECPESLLVETWEAIEASYKPSDRRSKPGVTVQKWNSYIRSHPTLKGVVPMAQSPTLGGNIRGMTWSEFSAWIDEYRSLVNDRVESVAIIDLDEPVAVYDIEVDGVHNFGITDLNNRHDIVVHNSEYVFLDDTACNLASLNLLKFRRPDGTFDAQRFRAACRIFITAQEILVDHASYPTPEIALNSHRFRPLGLGYANLGALIMSMGLPYDSDEARSLAGAITAIMTGEAALASAQHAANLGAFDGFAANREPMMRVMFQHRNATWTVPQGLGGVGYDIAVLWHEANTVWNDAVLLGGKHGYRNSQFTVIAPTGTIAFMMGCDTTGVEPDIALVKYKQMAGRGMLKLVNRTVPMALETLGYSEAMIKGIIHCIDNTDTIENCWHLNPDHLPVFDCAFPPANGTRSIHWRGHVRMLAAVQPFVSGSISKTINMPADSTVTDIREAYLEGWRLGLKAMAIYRDNSKGSQPVSTAQTPRGLEVDPASKTEDIHDNRVEFHGGTDGGDPRDPDVDRGVPVEDRIPDGSLTSAPMVGEDAHFLFPSKPPAPDGPEGDILSVYAPLAIPSRRGGFYGGTLAEVGDVWDILADHAVRTVPADSEGGDDPRTMADIAREILASPSKPTLGEGAGGAQGPPWHMLVSYGAGGIVVDEDEVRRVISALLPFGWAGDTPSKILSRILAGDPDTLAGLTRNPHRQRLPDTRDAVAHKFNINGTEGYFHVGMFLDGRPGELFITMAKEGSTLGGAMDAFATSVSMMLQYRVPLDVIVAKFSGANYDPKGFTKNPDIPIAKSITDYVARWLGMRFLPGYRETHAPRRPSGLEGEASHDLGRDADDTAVVRGSILQHPVDPGSAGADRSPGVAGGATAVRVRDDGSGGPGARRGPGSIGPGHGTDSAARLKGGTSDNDAGLLDIDPVDGGHISGSDYPDSSRADRSPGVPFGPAEQGRRSSGRQADGLSAVAVTDGAVCDVCGQLMIRRAGPCYVCDSCGNTSGGCS
jgi:ribonucleotide reductase alpha subunit